MSLNLDINERENVKTFFSVLKSYLSQGNVRQKIGYDLCNSISNFSFEQITLSEDLYKKIHEVYKRFSESEDPFTMITFEENHTLNRDKCSEAEIISLFKSFMTDKKRIFYSTDGEIENNVVSEHEKQMTESVMNTLSLCISSLNEGQIAPEQVDELKGIVETFEKENLYIKKIEEDGEHSQN